MPTELLPVFQITLPIILTIAIAVIVGIWFQNSRFADLRGDLAEIKTDIREIRSELKNQGERITKLEERIPPLVHHH